MTLYRVQRPTHDALGDASEGLKKLLETPKPKLLEMLLSGDEAPSDPSGNFRLACLLLKIFEFDGLITCVLQHQMIDRNVSCKKIFYKDLKCRIRVAYKWRGLASPLGKEPFQSAMKVVKERDKLVHPKLIDELVSIDNVTRASLFKHIDSELNVFYNKDTFNKAFDSLVETIRNVKEDFGFNDIPPNASRCID